METKFAIFKDYLHSDELVFLMEAHNGLSAKIAEEAGFKALWASGLTMSASQRLRDCNELSCSQVLDTLEFMSEATLIPIVVDGDTGYGNFNNFRIFVKKLCQRNIAGVCIEDKLFPKMNSFIDRNQHLTTIDEFCGKIKAGKDSQLDANFSIIARTEALICGYGLDEALCRAEAYIQAGADAILIHSKQSQADEIFAFAQAWEDRSPLIIVPTKYYSTPTELFKKHKISMVIWANHSLRASIHAMQTLCKRLVKEETLANIESSVAQLDEIFRLVNDAELKEAEEYYASVFSQSYTRSTSNLEF